MKNTKRINKALLALFAVAAFWPAISNAWWDGSWTVRKKVNLNMNQLDAKEDVTDAPVLIRLHTGAFDFSNAKDDGSDLRFVASDDKTPLKYHIEKFDPVNEMAFIWVKVPKLAAGKAGYIWMYSGNDKAVPATDAKATYDVNQVAVYHFGEKDGLPQDMTGYANNASQFTATRNPGSLIGGGLTLDGKGSMIVPSSPSLALVAGRGWTVSAWIKIAAAQNQAVIFSQQDGEKSVLLGIDGTKLYAVLHSAAAMVETPHTAELVPGSWHHVALTADKKLTLYLDGKEVAALDGELSDMQGEITVGKNMAGELDELELSNVARPAAWINVEAKSQGPDSLVVGLGEDESKDSGGSTSYFGTILHSVTLDGWVVIGILMVMAVISWLVMALKSLVIGKVQKINKVFLADYNQLAVTDTAKLDAQDEADDFSDSPLLSVLAGKHDHYQDSPLYRIYHTGVQEVQKRFGNAKPGEQNLTPQALGSIRAMLDATMVRENQKLNSLMVLLTIAISGGPFLGLLGTVVGVMITFAAIAATGDVNVAAIAPGIAAALVATVAGLGVAIPALFGYNYIGSNIKNVTADMHVFSDEFLSRLTEAYSS